MASSGGTRGAVSNPKPGIGKWPAHLSKAAAQLSFETGNVVRIFPSLNSAAQTFTPHPGQFGPIMQVCDGKQESAFGHKWKDVPTLTGAEIGDAVVGHQLKVFWPDDHSWYHGEVAAFDEAEGKHAVAYRDGDIETIILSLEMVRWTKDNGRSKPVEQICKTGRVIAKFASVRQASETAAVSYGKMRGWCRTQSAAVDVLALRERRPTATKAEKCEGRSKASE